MQTPNNFGLFFCAALSASLLLAADTEVRGEAAQVRLLRPPDDGIQPQAAVDSKGVVHLIYFKGDPKGGDIFYVRRAPGQEQFSKAIPVNTHPHTAMALGTIRGAQLAVGKNARIHVAWDGMGDGVAAVTA